MPSLLSLLLPPPPLHKINPMPWIAFLPLWILFLLFPLFTSSSFVSAAEILYSEHCGPVVRESTPTGLLVDSQSSFQIWNGYLSGVGNLFHYVDRADIYSPPSFQFTYKSLHKTKSDGILQIEGTLVLLDATDRTHGYGPSRKLTFDLSGFWSESIGMLCMVGHGVFKEYQGAESNLDLSALLKLSYSKSSSISTSLVNGTVEIFNLTRSPNSFDSMPLIAYAQKKYDFTMIPQANKSCSSLAFEPESASMESASTCDHLFQSGRRFYSNRQPAGRLFRLDYMSSHCSGSNCRSLGSSLGFTPRFLSLNIARCLENGSIHLYIGFHNSSSSFYYKPMIPEESLVAEGYWDADRSQLCLIACRLIKGNSQNGYSVGDCTIGMNLWFPTIMTLRNRSDVVGRIWSNKKNNDDGYFSTVSIQSMNNAYRIPGLKYNYSVIDTVRKYCNPSSGAELGEKRYPDGKSSEYMGLQFSLRDASGSRTGWGDAKMLSLGDKFYGDRGLVISFPMLAAGKASSASASKLVKMNHNIWNVSYEISFHFWNSSDHGYEKTQIAAEGIYNNGTGTICMKGCRYPLAETKHASLDSDTIDCEILINIQLPPLNPKNVEEQQTKGTISSTRSKSDPLYFETIELKSDHMYRSQAEQSIWRMDMEIIMVLISLTISSICIALQIFHVKKHRDSLPSMSITMLVVLVLGNGIPLVLNFEALFMNEKHQNVLLQSGRWLETNEMIVRAISMIAFFLSFRLIHLAWTARSAEEGQGAQYWVQERTVIRLCFPLYFAGGLLSWLVSFRWQALICYSGLVFDGFLLPQIVLNVCRNSKEKVLTPFFYIGITIARSILPHLYDAYQARHFVPLIDSSYIYRSANRDFYSSAWDIIIPCEGLILASLIYLQQRFGGVCFLPRRFSKFSGYEAVPELAL